MKHRNFSVEDLLADESFQRWALEAATDEEARYWSEWTAEKLINERKAEEAKNILSPFGYLPNVNASPDVIDAEWIRLSQRLQGTASNESFSARILSSRVLLVRIAASLLILVVLAVLLRSYYIAAWPFLDIETLATGPGEITRVTLPDGSTIVLNANSLLTYAGRNRGPDTRKVTLQGEAHFSVRRQPYGESPHFDVHTASGIIRVLGTTFDVTGAREFTRVSVSEGLVAVDRNWGGEADSSWIEVAPGQLAEIRRADDSISMREVNPEVYSSWMGSRLVFDKTPFSEVLNRLQRTYGYEVHLQDSSVLDISLDGWVENDQEVLFESLSRLIYRSVTLQDRRIVVE